MAEIDEIAQQAAQDALTRAYSRVADRQRVTEDAERAAMDDLTGRFRHGTQPFPGTQDTGGHERGASAPRDPAATQSTHATRSTRASDSPPSKSEWWRHFDKYLVLPLLGAMAGTVTIVYFLGGIYAYAQLRQASLPTAALVDMPSRSMINSGVVIAAIGFSFGAGLIFIVDAITVPTLDRSGKLPSLTSFIQLVWGRIRASVRQFLQGSSSSIRDAVSSPLTGSAAATAAAAGVAGELTDSGLGGAMLLGGTGLTLVLLVLTVLASLDLLAQHHLWSRAVTLPLIVVCVALGAYEAGSLRPFRLPTAEIRFLGATSCLEGGYLSQDASNVYIADGKQRTLRLLPTKAIAGLLVYSRQLNVQTGSTRTVGCPKALMEPGP